MSKQAAYGLTLCKYCDQQGMLEVVKETQTGKLHIVCSECDTEYASPKDALNDKNPTVYTGGRTTPATLDEIEAKGWAAYLMK